MLRPTMLSVALIPLLVGLAATAHAAPTGASAPRSIVLTGKAGEAPLIFLAPDSFTFIILDAPILRESVEVEGRARFSRVDPGDTIITLALAAPLGPGERLALRFTYRAGFPSSVVFLLTGKPGEGDTVVNVSRPQQTLEACREELAAARERCEAQSQELEELKARPSAVSPAAIALSGLVDSKGMEGADFWKACEQVGGQFHAARCSGLGTSTWSVVALEVSNTGAEPWAPAWAEVTPEAGGTPRRARAVLSGQPVVAPGATVRVAVEVAMEPREKRQFLNELHTLRVCDAAGSRCLSISKVKL